MMLDRNAEIPVVVVHGVGAQKRGETARDFATTLARAIARSPQCANHFVRVYSEDVALGNKFEGDDRDGLNVPKRTVLNWGLASQAAVYEFYWAKLSSIGESTLRRLHDVLTILLWLPSLGLLAMTYGEGALRNLLLMLLRSTYIAVWVCLLGRFGITVGVKIAQLSGMFADVRANDLLLPCDLLTAACLLCLLATSVSCRLYSSVRVEEIRTALMALTVTFLLLDVVPTAIADRAGEVLDHAASSDDGAPARPTSERSTFKPADGRPHALCFTSDTGELIATSDWFYSPVTGPGIWPYLNFGVVMLWAAIAAASYGIVRLAGSWSLMSAETVAQLIDRLQSVSRTSWLAISMSVLLIAPFWMLWDFWSLTAHTSPYPIVQSARRAVVSYLDWYCDSIFTLFVIAAGLVLLSSKVRAASAPLLELALDVLTYFRHDSADAPRWLLPIRLGNRVNRIPVSRLLHTRLATLVSAVARAHGTPVVVVSHSLGSVVAVRSLIQHVFGKEEANVLLVTMGSPLEVLRTRFPRRYASWFGNGQTLPDDCWTNLYRASDVVGRRVGALPDQKPLGQGGHIGYFHDSRVVTRVLQLIRPPENGASTDATPTSDQADLDPA